MKAKIESRINLDWKFLNEELKRFFSKVIIKGWKYFGGAGGWLWLSLETRIAGLTWRLWYQNIWLKGYSELIYLLLWLRRMLPDSTRFHLFGKFLANRYSAQQLVL